MQISLQTDWFPQPEHGGFYQALAKGYYEEAGLDVDIIPGGPNAMSTQKILSHRAHFAMNRADTIYELATRNVPVQMIMSTLQHDPQGVLLHADNPISSLSDLDGKKVMAIPSLMWVRWLEAKYGINIDVIPHDFGLDRFLNDPAFIQQCLITNEPFYVEQAGYNAKVLPLRESGFDPPHGIYCLREFAVAHPEIVRKFVQASIRGWTDYIMNDPGPALAIIGRLNPKMNGDFMAFSYDKIKADRLVSGSRENGNFVGNLDAMRLTAMAKELKDLGLIEEEPEGGPSSWYTRQFLTPLDEQADALP